MTKEMYAANVKNWLMDLATGAKAARKAMQFADEKPECTWKVTARCFDQLEDGVSIHNLKAMATAIDEPVHFSEFAPDEYLYGKYPGYWYFEMFGVKFYDFVGKEEIS